MRVLRLSKVLEIFCLNALYYDSLIRPRPISVFVSRYTWYECAAGRRNKAKTWLKKRILEHAVLQLWLVGFSLRCQHLLQHARTTFLSHMHTHTHTRARARARTHTHSEFRIFELFYFSWKKNLSGPAYPLVRARYVKMSTARYNIEKKKKKKERAWQKERKKDENGKWRKMHRLIKNTIELFYMDTF